MSYLYSLIFLASVAMFSVLRCVGSEEEPQLNADQIIKSAVGVDGGDGWCPSKQPPQQCSVNPLTGCNCPLGYSLIVELTSTLNAYCQLICFDSAVTCPATPTPSLGECVGPVIQAPLCTLGQALNITDVCNASTGACGDLLVTPNGNYYCISGSTAVDPSNTAYCSGSAFNTQCITIQNTTCGAALTQLPSSLLTLPCVPPCPQSSCNKPCC